MISRSAASAGRRHDAAERIVGSALEPYTAKPDRQVFLIDVEETWVARYEYELQDGAPVFTAVRVFAGSVRDVGYGPDEAGPPSPRARPRSVPVRNPLCRAWEIMCLTRLAS